MWRLWMRASQLSCRGKRYMSIEHSERRFRSVCQPLERRWLFDAGGIDDTFGGGLVDLNNTRRSEIVRAIATYADGRVLLVGQTVPTDVHNIGQPAAAQMLMARYRADGTLDGSFGTAGQI